jgi:hypothetical protein
LYSFDLAGMRDVIDMIIFYNDLTGRWPLHMGSMVISEFSAR